jgi:hypothetical protein
MPHAPVLALYFALPSRPSSCDRLMPHASCRMPHAILFPLPHADVASKVVRHAHVYIRRVCFVFWILCHFVEGFKSLASSLYRYGRENVVLTRLLLERELRTGKQTRCCAYASCELLWVGLITLWSHRK